MNYLFKNFLLVLILLLFIAACEERKTNVTFRNTSSNYDNRLSFYDFKFSNDSVEGFRNANDAVLTTRDVENNLTGNGALQGNVLFAQSHTIAPSGNAHLEADGKTHFAPPMPSLVPFRSALLLFTPKLNNGAISELLEIQSISVTVQLKDGSVKELPLTHPFFLPKADRVGSGKDITWSKRAWSALLDWNIVAPGSNYSFKLVKNDGTVLENTLSDSDIDYASPTEGTFLFIKVGMLTDFPTDGDAKGSLMINEPARAAAEYFQTVSFARLTVGQYEPRSLSSVIISSGQIYDNKSSSQDIPNKSPNIKDTNASTISGDMRENVGKSQISVGINLANFGIPSWNMTQGHRNKNDQFLMTVHHSQGLYTNTDGSPVVVRHGLSGGNGIGTFMRSQGNEFSHEVAHFYAATGHYPLADRTAYCSRHGYETGWGYDAYKNRMRANIKWNSQNNVESFYNWSIPSFQGTYMWNHDCMADGDTYMVSGISQYNHNTGWSTYLNQREFFNTRYMLYKKSDNEYAYRTWDLDKRDYDYTIPEDFTKNRPNPTKMGVEVITILGGYNPDNLQQTVIYPYFRANYGNVFDQLFLTSIPSTLYEGDPAGSKICYLEVNYHDGSKKYVQVKGSRHNENTINQVQLNIAADDKPSKVTFKCNGHSSYYQNSTNIPNTHSVALPKVATIGMEKGYDDIIAYDIQKLEESLANKTLNNYLPTLSDADKMRIVSLQKYNKIDQISIFNVREMANDYAKIYNDTEDINKFIYDNYYSIQAGDSEIGTRFNMRLKQRGLMTSENLKASVLVVEGLCLARQSDDRSLLKTDECANYENDDIYYYMDTMGRIHLASEPEKCVTKDSTLTECSESETERFEKVSNSDGTISFKYMANPNQCIDRYRAQNRINLYSCGNGSNQKFTDIPTNNDRFLTMNGSISKYALDFLNPKYIIAE